MASLQVHEAAAAAGARLVAGDPGARLSGAAIDSRAVRGGEIFFAFAGAQADGHRFVGDAFRRGAAGAMVSDLSAAQASAPTGVAASPSTGPAVLLVDDTLAALHAVARRIRQRVPQHLVGITGSAGKTTTKELLAAMLARRFRVARNPGNFNNLYGFPLALLNVADDAEWMVAELGMSEPGELRQLSLLARPDVAVFTVVRPVHLAFFDSVQGIAEAKAELLDGLAAGGLVVANAGDPEVARIARRWQGAGPAAEAPRRVVWYGFDETSDVVARDVAAGPHGQGSRFLLVAGRGGARVEQAVDLPLHGLYNVENCLAAAACAWALGVPLADISAAAAGAQPAAGRGVVHRVRSRRGTVTVIDDSYNSNPDALTKALAGAAQLPAGRRLAVLGDMLELGPDEARFHREAGREAARRGFTPVVAVGELSRGLADGARAAGAAAEWFDSAAPAAERISAEVRDGDVVLVKGSRGIGLDGVVRRLLALEGEG